MCAQALMFADIVLHRRMPRHIKSFTYKAPENLILGKGQLVNVPFRKKSLPGIVIDIHSNRPKYETKEIISTFPIVLPAPQIQFAEWMSEKYKCSLGNALELFIPDKIWGNKTRGIETEKDASEKAQENKDVEPGENATEKVRATEDKPAEKALRDFTTQLLASKSPTLLFEKNPLPRNIFYENLAAFAEEGQILFLFPEIFFVEKLAKGFTAFHGSLSEMEKARVWEGVRKGDIKFIAGTRAALFLPFKKLRLISLDFEDHESYIEKRQPKYDSIDAAEKLAEIFDAHLIAISSTPKVETWYKCETGSYKQKKWSDPKSASSVEIIDMADERKKGNFSPLSALATEKIARNLSQFSQTLLFINKTGEAGALVCRDCGNVIRCSTCNSPMALHKNSKLKCHRCKIEISVPSKCGNCGSANIRSLGYGTEKLEKEIKRIFGKAHVLRLDRESVSGPNKTELLNEENLEKTDILVATQIIDKPLNLPRLKLTIAASLDSILNFSDFRSEEKVFRLATHLKHITKGPLMIQTYLPDHRIFEILRSDSPETFYKTELEIRKSLNLPPFARTC